MQKQRAFFLIIGLLGIVFYSIAQENLQDTLTELVITSTKITSKLCQSNKAVTVIDHSDLQKYNGTSLSQILNSIAGIQVNGAWSNASKDQAIYTRGAKNDYTVILLDGIAMQDPSGIGGAIDLRFLNTNQIQRIEILKGAQTSLHGSDAIAGIINIITRKKTEDGFTSDISFGVGSFKSLDAGINGAYRVKKNAFNFSINHSTTAGISEANNIQSDTFDRDGFNQFNVRLSTQHQLSKSISVNPFYSFQKIKGENDGGAFLDNQDSYSGEMQTFGMNNLLAHTRGSLIFNMAVNNTRRSFFTEFGNYSYKGTVANLDLYSDFKLTDNITALLGLDYRYQTIQDESKSIPAANFISPYMSAVLKNGRLGLQADLRYTQHDVYNTFTYSFNPSFDLVTDKLKWRMSVGTGFKSPTLSQLYGPWGPNANLRPELGKTFETGTYYIDKHKTFSTSLVYFRRDINNLIAFTDKYINFDRQLDYGWEASLKKDLNTHLSLRSEYTYLQGKFTTQNNTTYNNLYRRPSHRFNTTLDWVKNKNLAFMLHWMANGKSTDLDFNSWPAKEVSLARYHLINLSTRVKFTRHSLVFNFNNLLNTKYQEVYGYSHRPRNFMIHYSISF